MLQKFYEYYEHLLLTQHQEMDVQYPVLEQL